MGSQTSRARLALEGTIAQRDLTIDEVGQLDAMLAFRIDDAVARADFASAPLPDFTGASPDPHGVLADLASRVRLAADERDRLHEALTRLEHVLHEQ
jgi:hypothetical protein